MYKVILHYVQYMLVLLKKISTLFSTLRWHSPFLIKLLSWKENKKFGMGYAIQQKLSGEEKGHGYRIMDIMTGGRRKKTTLSSMMMMDWTPLEIYWRNNKFDCWELGRRRHPQNKKNQILLSSWKTTFITLKLKLYKSLELPYPIQHKMGKCQVGSSHKIRLLLLNCVKKMVLVVHSSSGSGL